MKCMIKKRQTDRQAGRHADKQTNRQRQSGRQCRKNYVKRSCELKFPIRARKKQTNNFLKCNFSVAMPLNLSTSPGRFVGTHMQGSHLSTVEPGYYLLRSQQLFIRTPAMQSYTQQNTPGWCYIYAFSWKKHPPCPGWKNSHFLP